MPERISELIKKQYTVYPYPPIPVGMMENEVLYSTNYEFVNYLCTGKYKSQNQVKILDVGCGTGFSTLKLAQQNPQAFITALDISDVSIKIAKQRLSKARVNSRRIKFIKGDLMLMKDLNERFDYIVCTGVLHHMESPEKGLNFIKRHLKDEGLIYLMLYSEYGRFYQTLMRKTIALFQSDKTDIAEGIKIGKEILKILPNSHPILSRYNKSYEASLHVINKEFADSESQFVDAYINAKERTYNIDELFEFIEGNGLRFIRFQDELQWDLKYLLNGNDYLISKTKKFSKMEKYKIGEIIEAEKNFAFFAAKHDFKKKVVSNNNLMAKRIKLTQLNRLRIFTSLTNEKIYELTSPLGVSLKLDETSYRAFSLLKEYTTVEENLNIYLKRRYSEKLTRPRYLSLIKNMEEKSILLFCD